MPLSKELSFTIARCGKPNPAVDTKAQNQSHSFLQSLFKIYIIHWCILKHIAAILQERTKINTRTIKLPAALVVTTHREASELIMPKWAFTRKIYTVYSSTVTVFVIFFFFSLFCLRLVTDEENFTLRSCKKKKVKSFSWRNCEPKISKVKNEQQ